MILPGGTLGVVGGGQLGRMFTAEAQRMGYHVVVLDPDSDAPAGRIADRHLVRPWTDPDALTDMGAACDAITTEFENVPAASLRALAAHAPIRPSAAAVAPTQNRIDEKELLASLGIAVGEWAPVRTARDLDSAWRVVGSGPAVLKTATLGYDGKGQQLIASASELAPAFAALGGKACVLERRLELDREVSVMVARGADGNVVTWPLAGNVHINGILHTSAAPADVPEALSAAARDTATTIITALDYVGVMGVECFVVGGAVLVNEVAPRPHNSGHWTLDACETSQFEQQVRTLAGLPLGTTDAVCAAVMVNLLGDLWQHGPPRWERALAVPGVRLHLYGKTTARPGRKMGHLTALGPTGAEAHRRAMAAWGMLANSDD
ncbi:MAG: 5-(carboxyamino)imidazole ribonucleotide synthase [Gemmatimonadales bacterium]|nr:5-(carboxyamino)imidazole ribonucleotide synthase [Gemmatimonadales bacterium]